MKPRTCHANLHVAPCVHGCARGFTLIELLFTLALIGVLMAIAAPSFVQMRRNSQLVATTNEVLNGYNAARSEALKRNVPVGLEFVMKDGKATGWRVFVDADYSGAYNSGDELVMDAGTSNSPGIPKSVSLAFSPVATGGTVIFNASGYAVGQAQRVTLTTAGGQERQVVVSMAGRIRSCTPTTSKPKC